MKKTLLLLLTAAVAASSCTNKGYTVKGDIQGTEGTIYLALMQGKMPEIIDSVQSVDGKFEFKGELKNPMLAQVQSADKKTLKMFYIENSPIIITGNIEQLDSVKVVGSAEDALAQGFIAKINAAGDNRMEVMDEIIASNPKSVAAAYLFFRQRVPYLDYKQMREGIAGFDTTLTNIVYLQQVAERANTLEKVDIGKPFVDFELPDTTGKMVKLSDIAGKGKYVLLDFWASWCSPCRAENPNVVKDFKKYGDKGFTVFGVSLDRNAEDWKKGIVADGLEWSNVSDLKFWNCVPAQMYGVGSIPSNVLIDPQGIIIARNLRGENLTDELEKLLGDKK